MIQNHRFDNRLIRGIYLVLFIIAIILIYFSTLFRKDAYLILGITFALYGILRLAKRMVSGVSVDKLDRILFYAFVLLSLFPLSYGVWLMLIHTKMIAS
ncbi:hypothetical protein [uncultured Gimesia sp.]|uniref:hypothetical protein n=1 Tax=uncultured Gimesia sp. TaxID=1678688 RepID=UPI0030D700FB|tara:strand:- start:12230 stop:12526 length:297 start_codon:yes stop_codon:yes gene_type:complete